MGERNRNRKQKFFNPKGGFARIDWYGGEGDYWITAQ
jgi:hypothetical protein